MIKFACSIVIAGALCIGAVAPALSQPIITCDQRGCSDSVPGYQHSAAIKTRISKARIEDGVRFLPHPSGCPRVAFCACGAAVEIFGVAKRELWPARAWYKFPRSSPGYKMVAVRNHHVFVLISQVSGNEWLVRDYNSGGHKSREHVRSITGYTVVNPHSGLAMN